MRVLLSGQSNAQGWGIGGPAWSNVSPSVRVWNNVNPRGALGTAWVTPTVARQGGTFVSTNKNNLGVWFCDRVARAQGVGVDLTVSVWEGRSIDYWNPDRQTDSMLDYTISVWQATGQAPAEVFLWHQGEADAATDPIAHRANFHRMLDALTDAGVIDAQTIVIVGGLFRGNVEYADFTDRALFPLTRGGRVVFANSGGLTSADNVHFDGRSLARLGARYFNAYRFAKLRALA